MLEDFKAQVCEANRRIFREGLAELTWGNVSGFDRHTETVGIKPTSMPFEDLRPHDIVLVDLDGNLLEGFHRPSSDTPTHCLLYKAFRNLGAICHTPSQNATMFAQACQPIPCTGAIHAAHFDGDIPVTPYLTQQQVNQSYEANTGRVIIETFREQQLDPMRMPGVLVAGHGPFTWGSTIDQAVTHAIALETVARVQLGTQMINPSIEALPGYIRERLNARKRDRDRL